MNVFCPRCGKGQFIDDNMGNPLWIHCNAKCGMSHAHDTSIFRYQGSYIIYWHNGYYSSILTPEWILLCKVDHLPWDVTMDEIKMLLVFQ